MHKHTKLIFVLIAGIIVMSIFYAFSVMSHNGDYKKSHKGGYGSIEQHERRYHNRHQNQQGNYRLRQQVAPPRETEVIEVVETEVTPVDTQTTE